MRAHQVVHRDIEKSLDLSGVQVHGQNPVRACGGDQVGNQFRGDGVTALGLAVLTGVAEIRDDGSDTAGGSAAHSVDHDQKFHKVVVDRTAGGLYNEHILAADGLVHGDGALPVSKLRNGSFAQLHIELLAYILRKCGVGVAGKYLDLFAVSNHFSISS